MLICGRLYYNIILICLGRVSNHSKSQVQVKSRRVSSFDFVKLSLKVFLTQLIRIVRLFGTFIHCLAERQMRRLIPLSQRRQLVSLASNKEWKQEGTASLALHKGNKIFHKSAKTTGGLCVGLRLQQDQLAGDQWRLQEVKQNNKQLFFKRDITC